MSLDKVDQRLSGHNGLHIREKLLPFGLPLGSGPLAIGAAELFAAHHHSLSLRSQAYCPADGLSMTGST